MYTWNIRTLLCDDVETIIMPCSEHILQPLKVLTNRQKIPEKTDTKTTTSKTAQMNYKEDHLHCFLIGRHCLSRKSYASLVC